MMFVHRTGNNDEYQRTVLANSCFTGTCFKYLLTLSMNFSNTAYIAGSCVAAVTLCQFALRRLLMINAGTRLLF